MREASKSKKIWKADGIELKILQGKGIDIGPADDPIFPDVKCFDMEDGDANIITQYVKDQYDYVFASHCLEHMHNPHEALQEWWKLVKVGGHIFFAIPDEDLYEQGVFPSRFNPDHKATFTISKTKSWSPLSVNVLDLAHSLPGGQLINIALQDHNYDRSIMTFGPRKRSNFLIKGMMRAYFGIKRRTNFKWNCMERFFLRYHAVDQTSREDTLAQIACIVKKVA